MGVSIGYLLVHERWDLLERGNLSVDLGWKVAWGLSRTPVLGRRLSIEDSVKKGVRGPACRSGAGEPLAGMLGRRARGQRCLRKVN